jgi:hypothetical protein
MAHAPMRPLKKLLVINRTQAKAPAPLREINSMRQCGALSPLANMVVQVGSRRSHECERCTHECARHAAPWRVLQHNGLTC